MVSAMLLATPCRLWHGAEPHEPIKAAYSGARKMKMDRADRDEGFEEAFKEPLGGLGGEGNWWKAFSG